MMTSLDRILDEARELDADQRAQLALNMLESLDAVEPASDVEQAWNAGAVQRLAEYDAGDSATVSSEDLHSTVLTPRRVQ